MSIARIYDRAVTALLDACYWIRGLYRQFWPWSGWRRGIARAVDVAAADAEFRRRLQPPDKPAGPERWVRVLREGQEVKLLCSVRGGEPGTIGSITLTAAGAWLGWKAGGAFVYSVNPAVGFTACDPCAGLQLLAPVHNPPLARCWAEGDARNVRLIPGRTICFWPGRVEVVGP